MARSDAALALCAAMLAGCSSGGGSGDGGSGGGSGVCQAVGYGSYVSAAANPPSAFDDPVLAFDGHLDSWATLSPAASASATISGGGISRMAGEIAGVAFTTPASGTVSISITTYKNGLPLDSGPAGTTNFTPTGEQSTCPGYCVEKHDGQSYFGINTQQDFDEIEATISVSNLSAPLQVRELCVN